MESERGESRDGLKLGDTWATRAAPPQRERPPTTPHAATTAVCIPIKKPSIIEIENPTEILIGFYQVASARRKEAEAMPSRTWAGRGVGWQRAGTKPKQRAGEQRE